MKRYRGWMAAGLIGLLAGCGGGGGGGGAGPYKITLRADTTLLPLNLFPSDPYNWARVGSSYTTTLYVSAEDNGGRPIPGGEGVFSCSVVGGLESSSLYYLNGDEEHLEDYDLNENGEIETNEEKIRPISYRAIVLDGNAGAASFHVHSKNIAGTTAVRCTVNEPGTNIQRSATVNIQVGGQPTGKASQVILDRFDTWLLDQGYLFIQGINVPNQGQLRVNIVDEAGQAVPNPIIGTNNLQVRIVPDADSLADDTATLRGINGSGTAVAGSAIHVASINGQAQFTLVSGNSPGNIFLEFIADRADNNVGNGIAEPIYNYVSVPIVISTPGSGTVSPLAITTTDLPAASYNVPYGALLEAAGGVAPYTWSLVTFGLPVGLTLNSSGVLAGTPFSTVAGSYSFIARVQDAQGSSVQKVFTLTYNYTAPPVVPPVEPPELVVSPSSGSGAAGATPLTFVISGGVPGYTAVSSNGAVATAGTVTQTGGQYRLPVTLVSAGTASVIITDNSGQAVTVTVEVTGASTGTGSDPVISPEAIAISECTENVPFIIRGGTAPFTVFSTDSVNVTATNPVTVGTFQVFTVTTNATSDPGATITVLDSNFRTDTAQITVAATHTACDSNPEVALSPSPVVLNGPGATQVVTITGGFDTNSSGAIAFTASTSDASVVTVGSVTAVAPYQMTLTAVAPGVAIVYVLSEDGQYKYVPVTVTP